MNIRDRFRKRRLGMMGWAGGNSQDQIPNTPEARAENTQTQSTARVDKPYPLGKRPPRRLRKSKQKLNY